MKIPPENRFGLERNKAMVRTQSHSEAQARGELANT